jgi:hypothetical protein
MKTIKFIITLLASTMLFSCEQPTTPTELKNNGPTLESRLCGIWNSVSKTPLGVAPEYSYPHECFDYKLIIDTNLIYTEYYKEKVSIQKKFNFNDTIYDKQNNKYQGKIILEDSLKIHFTIIQDNLYLTPISKGDDLVVGGSSIHYKKN